MPRMNDYIVNYQPKDYSCLSAGAAELDCSLGVNPNDLPQEVFDALKNIKQDIIKHYPHDDNEPGNKIISWYKRQGIGWLTADNLIFGCGSLDILFNINLLCLTRNQPVLGHMPQFTAYVDNANCTGSSYRGYALPLSAHYRFNGDQYLSQMKPEHRLFIIENPNNPTGQVIDLKGIQKIAEKANSMDAILIVDEAYGDYMEIKNSAINLIPRQPNVIVTRTFSKGFGMAGMRMGYAFASTHVFDDIGSDIFTQLRKLVNTFSCNGIARHLAAAMLDSGKPMIDTEQLQADKQSVLGLLHHSTVFKAAETSLRTPILTLICINQASGFDLQKSLLDHEKLLTVSCKTYDGFDANAVRIMLPRHEQTGMLIAKLRRAQDRLKQSSNGA